MGVSFKFVLGAAVRGLDLGADSVKQRRHREKTAAEAAAPYMSSRIKGGARAKTRSTGKRLVLCAWYKYSAIACAWAFNAAFGPGSIGSKATVLPDGVLRELHNNLVCCCMPNERVQNM